MAAVPFYWAQARPSSPDSKAPSRRVTGRGFNWRKRKLWGPRLFTLAAGASEVCSLADTLHALVIGIVHGKSRSYFRRGEGRIRERS